MSTIKMTLWATGSHDTNLYVRPTVTGYDWVMVSPKTGRHIIKQSGGTEPMMSDRIKAHWDGFQKLQVK
jgi:hypothetical protein